MNFIKGCLLALVSFAFGAGAMAQGSDYQFLLTLKPEMQRKLLANELFLSPDHYLRNFIVSNLLHFRHCLSQVKNNSIRYG